MTEPKMVLFFQLTSRNKERPADQQKLPAKPPKKVGRPAGSKTKPKVFVQIPDTAPSGHRRLLAEDSPNSSSSDTPRVLKRRKRL